MGLDRPAAAEFSFFLAMPTMAAAFGQELLEAKDHLAPERAGEIAIGFVMAFIASVAVVKPFLNFVRRSGFAPFAWYRIVLGVALLAALGAGWLRRRARVVSRRDRTGCAAASSPGSSSPCRSSSASRHSSGSSTSSTD